ncbi:MAG TPA: trypsin-like peptidase domain-containing protein [Candidatus Binatia bacterium]|jgi:hypothetical protein|nr:trypsin-like peptidase domain-containing protein [Candidatus Binatia bacterium]
MSLVKILTLAQRLLFNTVRVETFDQSGDPVGIGTSFVISHELEGYGRELFLVTNKHVIEDGFTANMYFTKIKDGAPDIGNPFFVRFDMFEWGWHGHPDPSADISIHPISWVFDIIDTSGVSAFLTDVSTDIIVTPERAETLDAVEEILFIGYPNGLYDKKNYVPIIRRGTTATPISLDYDALPVFLIDASVFPGSSGSPVFRHIPTIDGQSLAQLELLGIISSVFFRTESGTIELRPAPTNVSDAVIKTREMIDLGMVYKSHLILETIDDFWEKHRDQADQLQKFHQAMRRKKSQSK